MAGSIAALLMIARRRGEDVIIMAKPIINTTPLLAELAQRENMSAEMLADLIGVSDDDMIAAFEGDTSCIPTAALQELAYGLGYTGNPFDLLEPRAERIKPPRAVVRAQKSAKLGGRTEMLPREQERIVKHPTTKDALTVAELGPFTILRGVLDANAYTVTWTRPNGMHESSYMGRFNDDETVIAAAPEWIRSHHIADSLVPDMLVAIGEARTEEIEEKESEMASKIYPDDAPKRVKTAHMYNRVLARSKVTCDNAAGAQTRAATVAGYAGDIDMGRPEFRENAGLAPHTTPREALVWLIDATANLVSDGYDDAATLLETLTDVFAYVGAANAAPVPEVEEVRRLFACYPAIAQRTVFLYESDTEDFEHVENIARFVIEMPVTVYPAEPTE